MNHPQTCYPKAPGLDLMGYLWDVKRAGHKKAQGPLCSQVWALLIPENGETTTVSVVLVEN